MEISGCIVTTDAMGCQRAIAGKIRSKGADYLLAVKGNQSTLHEDIQLFFDHLSFQQKLPAAADYHETLDKDTIVLKYAGAGSVQPGTVQVSPTGKELRIKDLELYKDDPEAYANLAERMLAAIDEPEIIDTSRASVGSFLIS